MIPISTRGIADSERVLLGKPYAGNPGSTKERMVGNWRLRRAAVRIACPFQPLGRTVRQGRLRRCVRLTRDDRQGQSDFSSGPASIHPGQIGPVVCVIHLYKIAQRIEGRQVSAEWPRFARARCRQSGSVLAPLLQAQDDPEHCVPGFEAGNMRTTLGTSRRF